MNVKLTESERQMLLMALAHLSIEHPGWDEALNRLALRFDDGVGERSNVLRARLYDEFRKLRQTGDQPRRAL